MTYNVFGGTLSLAQSINPFVCQREVVSTKNIDPLLAPAGSSVNIRRPTSLGDNNGLSATAAATGKTIVCG